MNREIYFFSFLFIISFILAVRAVGHELTAPDVVKKIKIKRRKKGLSGVILFLKEKIVHYSSDSS